MPRLLPVPLRVELDGARPAGDLVRLNLAPPILRRSGWPPPRERSVRADDQARRLGEMHEGHAVDGPVLAGVDDRADV